MDSNISIDIYQWIRMNQIEQLREYFHLYLQIYGILPCLSNGFIRIDTQLPSLYVLQKNQQQSKQLLQSSSSLLLLHDDDDDDGNVHDHGHDVHDNDKDDQNQMNELNAEIALLEQNCDDYFDPLLTTEHHKEQEQRHEQKQEQQEKEDEEEPKQKQQSLIDKDINIYTHDISLFIVALDCEQDEVYFWLLQQIVKCYGEIDSSLIYTLFDGGCDDKYILPLCINGVSIMNIITRYGREESELQQQQQHLQQSQQQEQQQQSYPITNTHPIHPITKQLFFTLLVNRIGSILSHYHDHKRQYDDMYADNNDDNDDGMYDDNNEYSYAGDNHDGYPYNGEYEGEYDGENDGNYAIYNYQGENDGIYEYQGEYEGEGWGEYEGEYDHDYQYEYVNDGNENEDDDGMYDDNNTAQNPLLMMDDNDTDNDNQDTSSTTPITTTYKHLLSTFIWFIQQGNQYPTAISSIYINIISTWIPCDYENLEETSDVPTPKCLAENLLFQTKLREIDRISEFFTDNALDGFFGRPIGPGGLGGDRPHDGFLALIHTPVLKQLTSTPTENMTRYYWLLVILLQQQSVYLFLLFLTEIFSCVDLQQHVTQQQQQQQQLPQQSSPFSSLLSQLLPTDIITIPQMLMHITNHMIMGSPSDEDDGSEGDQQQQHHQQQQQQRQQQQQSQQLWANFFAYLSFTNQHYTPHMEVLIQKSTAHLRAFHEQYQQHTAQYRQEATITYFEENVPADGPKRFATFQFSRMLQGSNFVNPRDKFSKPLKLSQHETQLSFHEECKEFLMFFYFLQIVITSARISPETPIPIISIFFSLFGPISNEAATTATTTPFPYTLQLLLLPEISTFSLHQLAYILSLHWGHHIPSCFLSSAPDPDDNDDNDNTNDNDTRQTAPQHILTILPNLKNNLLFTQIYFIILQQTLEPRTHAFIFQEALPFLSIICNGTNYDRLIESYAAILAANMQHKTLQFVFMIRWYIRSVAERQQKDIHTDDGAVVDGVDIDKDGGGDGVNNNNNNDDDKKRYHYDDVSRRDSPDHIIRLRATHFHQYPITYSPPITTTTTLISPIPSTEDDIISQPLPSQLFLPPYFYQEGSQRLISLKYFHHLVQMMFFMNVILNIPPIFMCDVEGVLTFNKLEAFSYPFVSGNPYEKIIEGEIYPERIDPPHLQSMFSFLDGFFMKSPYMEQYNKDWVCLDQRLRDYDLHGAPQILFHPEKKKTTWINYHGEGYKTLFTNWFYEENPVKKLSLDDVSFDDISG